MIRVDSLSFSYPPVLPDGERVSILDQVSFAVEKGACLAVTGSNGCGKTTLCLATAGLAPRLTGGRLTGRIEVGGHDVQTEPTGSLADLIGVVFEDPTGQLFNPTVEEEIAWGLENLGLPREQIGLRVEQALGQVGLEEVSRRQPPETLSGGQQRRLALAAALALNPAVLILDEPSGGLAPAACLEMIDVLRQLREQHHLTIFLTSTDPNLIAALADELILLESGRISAQGKPQDIYTGLDQSLFPGVEIPPASRFAHTVNHQRADLHLSCVTLEQAVEQTRSHPLNGHQGEVASVIYAERRKDASRSAPTSPAIELEAVSFAYQPDQPILRNLSLTIPTGQFVALTGDNGAGKTTLARHLIGLLRPTGGGVSVLGENAAGKNIGQLARQVGFVFQNPEVQIFHPTVREEVAFGPRNLGLGQAGIDEILEQFALLDVADYPPAALSFSLRRMVALASIAAMQAPILILDEPTVGLDAQGKQRVMGWLDRHHQAGNTIMLITHDMELTAAHAERVLVLHEGRIAADGPPDEIFLQGDVMEQAGLESPFSIQYADQLETPTLAADLTPQGTAWAWLEHLK